MVVAAGDVIDAVVITGRLADGSPPATVDAVVAAASRFANSPVPVLSGHRVTTSS